MTFLQYILNENKKFRIITKLVKKLKGGDRSKFEYDEVKIT